MEYSEKKKKLKISVVDSNGIIPLSKTKNIYQLSHSSFYPVAKRGLARNQGK
jgi:hypothetical protein